MDDNNHGKMILVYPVGGGEYTIEWPWMVEIFDFLDQNGDQYVITESRPLDSIYMVGGEVFDREDGPWATGSTVIEAGQDFEITGLPHGANVTVGAETYVITDGSFVFGSDAAGSFEISVIHPPYYPSRYEVSFV